VAWRAFPSCYQPKERGRLSPSSSQHRLFPRPAARAHAVPVPPHRDGSRPSWSAFRRSAASQTSTCRVSSPPNRPRALPPCRDVGSTKPRRCTAGTLLRARAHCAAAEASSPSVRDAHLPSSASREAYTRVLQKQKAKLPHVRAAMRTSGGTPGDDPALLPPPGARSPRGVVCLHSPFVILPERAHESACAPQMLLIKAHSIWEY